MILDDIHKIILDRKKKPSANSYVSRLQENGKDEMLKKIGEEAIEVIIASKAGDRKQIIHEMSDLWFHCLVLMAEDGITHQDIFNELRDRLEKKRRQYE